MDLQVHTDVIAAGKTKSGCTVHIVTEVNPNPNPNPNPNTPNPNPNPKDVDAGPIVIQKECPVLITDTPETLKAKVIIIIINIIIVIIIIIIIIIRYKL